MVIDVDGAPTQHKRAEQAERANTLISSSEHRGGLSSWYARTSWFFPSLLKLI
jgi:hypothetical protein